MRLFCVLQYAFQMRGFLRILLLLFLSIHIAFSDEVQSKLVYIKSEIVNPSELHYIGEIMAVKYSVLILEESQVRSIGFLETNGVSIQEGDSAFEKLDDGTLEKIIYIKITDKNFTLPRLEVIVENEHSSDVSVSNDIPGKAINLQTNHPTFSGVVAQSLNIRNYTVRQYDDKNNIIIIDFDAELANLEDFKIPNLKKQGFESFNSITTRSNGIFYVILSNQVSTLDFEYFDLNSQSYKQEHIKNVANHANISINQEIAPINKVLIFKNIIILVISFALFVAFFIRKIPLKVRIALLVLGVLLLVFVIISVNDKERGVITQDSYARILPTTNSTIIAKIPANTEVQIISKHNDYIKILTPENKTGWIKKENLQ